MAKKIKDTGKDLSAIESRKVKNWWARISLSWAIVGTFLILIYLLFFKYVLDKIMQNDLSNTRYHNVL